jgi:hypothetical protein
MAQIDQLLAELATLNRKLDKILAAVLIDVDEGRKHHQAPKGGD